MNEVVQLAIDAHRGQVRGNYSTKDSMETLREALIEANNGKTFFSYKDVRDGKCNGLFSIIEEIIDKEVIEGLQGNEFFMQMVDYRNLKEGDANEFYIPDKSLFVVSEIARGSQAIRRQRLNGGQTMTVPMQTFGIKIYEEMTRVLAGRIDMNEMIDRVSQSLEKESRERIFQVWNGVSSGDMINDIYYPTKGSYSEEALINLIDHVEAATGKTATIIGTRAALRKIKVDTIADTAKEDMYNMGYYGKFNGTNVVKINQVHKVGSTDFLMDNNKLIVVASDDKPIKYVTEGESTIILGNSTDNADFTQEYTCIENVGVAWMAADALGIYEMA